jgi:hypothetical protein
VRTWRTVVFIAVFALVLAAQAAVVAPGFWWTRIWEDEAYNLTVPINLLHGLGYTSDGMLTPTGTLTPFDVRISTGPTVLLPIAAVLATGIDTVVGARLVMLAFYLLLLGGLWLLGRRVAGRWGGLVAMTVPLALNTIQISPIQGPLDILGEYPSAALIVWAMLTVKKRPWLAGLLLGLAVQAKLLSLIALPVLVLMVWFAVRADWRSRLRRGAVLIVFTMVPTLLYELAILLSLGWAGFRLNTAQLKGFLVTTGQAGVHASRSYKVGLLSRSWFVPEGVAVTVAVVLLVIGVAAALVLWRRWANRSTVLAEAGCRVPPREFGVQVGGAVVLLVLWLVWWVMSTGTQSWIRYPAPALFCALPVVVAAALTGCRMLAGAVRALPHAPAASVVTARIGVSAAGAAVILALVAAVGYHVPAAYVPLYGETLVQQRAAAARIATLHQPRLASPWGTQLGAMLLAGARLVPLYAPARGDIPIVYGAWPSNQVYLREVAANPQLCGRTRLIYASYLVCSPPKADVTR